MKKSVLVGLLFAVLFIGFVSAADNVTSEDKADKAYACLNDQLNNKTSLSLQEAIFTTLALGSKDKANTVFESEKGTNCWPKSGCKVKDTAQVLLAYDRINKDSADIEKWIISQNATVTDLNWYIEIDITNQITASCTVKYDAQSATISIGSDMKLSGAGGSCISIGSNGYWLAVSKTASCLDKQYEISCDQDFITTTLYQKNSGATVFVSPETHSAASLGTTTEKVGAKCFRSGSACDYEGSLWAVVALKEKGYDVTPFVPYILALAEDNARYFPSAFGYILTGRDDQYGSIAQSQKQGKYWEMTSTPYNRYYDSALGMLSLVGTSSAERDSTKDYLLSIQTAQGCWNNNNIRDTSFILYAGWAKTVSSGGGQGSNEVFCQDVAKYCEQPMACLNAGGISGGETCAGLGDICCSVKVQEETCTQKNGIGCRYDERCSVAPVSSSDGDCCVGGSCEAIETITTTLCEDAFGACVTECGSNEELSAESCGSDSGLICCKAKAAPDGLGWLWVLLIVVLIILIVLVVLAILFRDKIRIWWIKHMGKGKGEVQTTTKPGVPPMTRPPFGRPAGPPFGTRPLTGRAMMPAGARPPMSPPIRPVIKPQTPKDKELEETIKKLKEMSK